MAKTKRKDEPKRKLGERTETVEIKLSPMQIEDERARVIDMLQERDELDEQWQSAKAAHKAKTADLDSRLEASRGAIRSAKFRREVVIEEWVTDQNEVVRLDKVTREELGRRNATAAELQEELPLPKPVSEDEETEKAVDDENDGDFGKEE